MSCPKTHHLLTEYLAESLTSLARDEIERHLENCPDCRAELAMLTVAREELTAWREERVPHWDRGLELFRREHPLSSGHSHRATWLWQWLPTTASFAMLALLILNVTVSSDSSGFRIAFGSADGQLDTAALEQRLQAFEASQQESRNREFQAFLARVDERQDSNNLRLMQAVLEQTSQITGENFDRMYAYFEQQRQQDLQTLQTGYEQLVDSDYQTLQNVQQLANFVRFQGEPR